MAGVTDVARVEEAVVVARVSEVDLVSRVVGVVGLIALQIVVSV